MRPFKYIIPVILLLILLTRCKSSQPAIDNSVVDQFDLNRYMGTWYEIARFNHPFERGLVGVTATYSMRPDGKIRVVNRGYKNSCDGELNKAKAKAKIPDPETPGKLKVSFFLFFYTGYYVMELDDEYQWALVGSSSDDYLWILSRTPELPQDTLDQILQKARDRGYDTDKLIWVEQCGEQNFDRG